MTAQEMNSRVAHARRKPEKRGPRAPARVVMREAQPEDSADAAANTARYIADLTAQLALMAHAAKLDLLVYFLNMANAESEAIARGAVDRSPL